jgi:glycosyltransferase involved in cell wall biosynthesis
MAQASTRLFAVSQPLCRKLREEFGIDAVALPNGADLERLRSVAVSEVEAVRERWGLRGKFVVGYIGNLGAFAGVDFAVRAYRELRRRRPDAVLFLVGPAAPWQDLRASTRGEGMIWTGPVAPVEIAAYVQALDLGLLVQEKSLGTEFAFQMKVIEYSACRKFVVSTPLRTWQQLAWPHVLLTELREELWADAMARAGELQWQAEWDELIEPFDWRRLAEQAARVMLGS